VAAIEAVWHLISLIALTLWTLISGLFVRAPVSPEVTGPLGIAIISGQVASLGALAYLQFLAILSVNLAFVNCLPFPALDGGRLFFIIIEWVRGKPVSAALERRIHTWGFTVLLLLVAVVTVHDVSQYFGTALVNAWNALRTFL
jgi:regulator of sigma E protease